MIREFKGTRADLHVEGEPNCKRLESNHRGGTCLCPRCFEKAPELATTAQCSLEGFGLISQEAKSAATFQMPEVNFFGADEISSSNLFNFESITQREVLPALSTAETDIRKAQSRKRRRLEAAPTKHSTILSQNADKHSKALDRSTAIR